MGSGRPECTLTTMRKVAASFEGAGRQLPRPAALAEQVPAGATGGHQVEQQAAVIRLGVPGRPHPLRACPTTRRVWCEPRPAAPRRWPKGSSRSLAPSGRGSSRRSRSTCTASGRRSSAPSPPRRPSAPIPSRHQAGRRGTGRPAARGLAAAAARGPGASALVHGHALPVAPPGRGALGGRAGAYRGAGRNPPAGLPRLAPGGSAAGHLPGTRPRAGGGLLEEWCQAAWRSDLETFGTTALTLTDHAPAIVNAIRLGINNARLEAMNSTVRLMSHRSRGFRRVESLLALIQLVCGKIPVALPT